MATYFWVDNGVNFGWSLTSGGAPAAQDPGSTDDVVINTNSGTSFSFGGQSYRNLTIATSTTTQIGGGVFLFGTFINNSSVVNIEQLFLYMEAITGTITVTTLNRPLAYLRVGPFSGSGTLATYSLGSAITAYVEVQNCNFNTNNHAVTGSFAATINAPFATTFNFGSSTFSSRSEFFDSFAITSNGGDFRFTLNLGTSKINNPICTINLGLNATMTASAGQAISNLNDTTINVASGNLAVTTGTISSSSISLSIDNTATVSIGAISVSGSLNISTSGLSTKTIGTINGNVQTPASVNISTDAGTLNIGAVGGVIANSISYLSVINSGVAANFTGLIRITQTLYINNSTATTITGAVTAGIIDTIGSAGAITRFNSTTTTTTGSIQTDGDTRFAGIVVSAGDIVVYGAATFSSAVTAINGIILYNDTTITFPAAVTATNISIYGPAVFTTGTHNIADTFEAYGSALSLGSSTLIVKRSLVLSVPVGGWTRGTSLIRVGGYVGDSNYPGRTFGRISTGFGRTGFYNRLELVGDVIIIDTELAADRLIRTGNANNFGETVLYGNIAVLNTNLGNGTALSITGNSATNRMLVRSSTTGQQRTVFNSINFGESQGYNFALVNLTNVDFMDIKADWVGTKPFPLFWQGTSLGNCQGNEDIQFTTSVTRYVRGSGNWNTTSTWASVSGGSSGASVPLPQDTVIIDSLSGTGLITTGNARYLGGNVTIQSGFVGTLNVETSTSTSGVRNKIEIYGQLTVQSTSQVIASDGITQLEFRNRVFPLTLNYNNTATIINTAVDIVNNRITLASPLGTSTLRFNNLTVYSGILNTAGFAVHIAEMRHLGQPNDGSLELTNSNIHIYNTFYTGVLSNNTSTVYSINANLIYAGSGSFYNLYFVNTILSKLTSISATVSNLVSSNHPSMPSTANFRISRLGDLPLRIQNDIDIGSNSARVSYEYMDIVNDSTKTIQTQFASYYNCTAAGTYSGVKLTGFGLSDLGGNSNIEFPSVIRAIAFSNVAAQTFTLPDDFTGSAVLIAIGGGGAGGVSSTTGGGGGGGGAYALSEVINLTRGQTIYVSSTQSVTGRSTVGTGSSGNTVWINTQSNTQPTTILQGVRATGGIGGGSGGGLGGTNALGAYTVNGRTGASSTTSTLGGGGGGAPGWESGSNAGSGSAIQGGGGGSLEFVTAAFNGSNANVTTNSTAGSSGTAGVAQGGGGGGGGFLGSTTKIGTYTRSTPSQTLTINSVDHGFVNGDRYSHTVTTTQTGTYSRTSGNAVITVTRTSHGLNLNDSVYLDFTSGSATDGYYTINQIVSSSQFRVTSASTFGTSGGVRILPFPSASTHTITVINDNQYTITTISTGPMTGTVSVPYISSVSNGSAGGNGSNLNQYQLNYFNSGAFIDGTALIGPGGGGGGGGGGSNFPGFNGSGGAGGQGGIGGGGGGAGRTNTTPVVSGAGGPGLAVILYAYGQPSAFSTIIGQL
jgi:hypothetical protein